ncbi:ArsR/SmtB family transcription factor [Geoglobus acetivorans]|uniref:HTH arsR-type domain-containing protein n=1 Tax=Geoglobus acetivorans TaxID=565033 RepID=A0A0A7GHI7_GEOAI|nr:hypothetical protein GACE_1371 [Geoglobus acetivorans]
MKYTGLKVLSDSKRKILQLLASGEKTWAELKMKTKLSDPVLAKHLKDLLKIGLIEEKIDREDRRKKIYTLNFEKLKELGRIRKEELNKLITILESENYDKEFEEEKINHELYRALDLLLNFIALDIDVDERLSDLVLNMVSAGWVKFEDNRLVLTDKGWKIVFEWLPTVQLQHYRVIHTGTEQIKIDDELKDTLSKLYALLLITGEKILDVIPENVKEEFLKFSEIRKEKYKEQLSQLLD